MRATITVGTVLKVNSETGPSNTRRVYLTYFRTIIYEFYKVFSFARILNKVNEVKMPSNIYFFSKSFSKDIFEHSMAFLVLGNKSSKTSISNLRARPNPGELGNVAFRAG